MPFSIFTAISEFMRCLLGRVRWLETKKHDAR
jgi:hypothetical protein